ncbi:hypothetical protein [Aurantibacter sp.]|uniref:hypothetical protein n=1 Tax=Aurantibacter sp. TaxID=2807103 RepID=UPI0035C7B5CA
MKNKHLLLLVAICVCFVTQTNAQRQKAKGTVNIKNGFAIAGGLTQYDILTDNFTTTKGEGWVFGMSATVDLPHKGFNVSYGMQLSENILGVAAKPSLTTSSIDNSVDYKIFTAQVAFLWHLKLGTDHLTLDIGPMLQYNSDLELKDEDKENYIIDGFNSVTAKDFKSLNNVNFNGAIGLTAGISHFKVKAQYIYGVTNILGGLNKEDFAQDLEKKFKGNQSMLAFTVMFSF